MPKFSIPGTIDDAPVASRPMLRTAEARFGRVPTMALLLSISPAALQGYLASLTALDGGALGAATAERIALAVAEASGCCYGLSLHTHHARSRVGLDDAEITANRNGASNDPQAEAAVRFATKLVRSQAAISEDDFSALKAAGYADAEIIEIILHAGLNMMAVVIAKAGEPDIDFPLIQPRKAD